MNETLQEMLSSIESEAKNLNLFYGIENFYNLSQSLKNILFFVNFFLDLKFLSQRVRFKVRFNENPEYTLNLTKSKSANNKEKQANFPHFDPFSKKSVNKESLDILEFKESLLKEIPLLVLSIEQFGTLEIIEDFLLNKITGKNDAQYGGIFNTIFSSNLI